MRYTTNFLVKAVGINYIPAFTLIKSRKLGTKAYTPGCFAPAQPFPHDTRPTRTPSTASGPPESP